MRKVAGKQDLVNSEKKTLKNIHNVASYILKKDAAKGNIFCCNNRKKTIIAEEEVGGAWWREATSYKSKEGMSDSGLRWRINKMLC